MSRHVKTWSDLELAPPNAVRVFLHPWFELRRKDANARYLASTTLPPKRRENTYRDEAMKAWFSGEPDLWVTQDTYSGTWYRMWNDEHRRGRFEVVG